MQNTMADLRKLATPEDYQEGAFGLKDFTKKEEHKDMFRVPTLRNVALTAPYFHTGSVSKLEDAVRIMFETQSKYKASTKTIKNVTAFLEAQTGKYNGKPLTEVTDADVTSVYKVVSDKLDNEREAQRKAAAEEKRKAEKAQIQLVLFHLTSSSYRKISSMVSPKYRAILYARGNDAMYFPTSMEVMVCRVVPTASASSS